MIRIDAHRWPHVYRGRQMAIPSLWQFVAILFVVSGCSSSKKDYFIAKKLERKLFVDEISPAAGVDLFSQSASSVSDLPPRNLLWRNDRLRLWGTNLDHPRYLVMVKYQKKSRLAHDISLHEDEAESSKLWFRYEPQDDSTGFALLALGDQEELGGLAAAAHRDSHPACGALELISSDLTVVNLPPSGPVYSELLEIAAVTDLFKVTKVDELKTAIASLESLGTRFHGSTMGQSVPQAVVSLWQKAAEGFSGFKMDLVAVNESTQKSVVASLPGQANDDQTVVLGAHLDSINGAGVGEPAPGADDDASGVATLREMIRVIAAKQLKFKRRIEFHAYGAEEVGLLGSSTLAQSYAKAGRPVVGMMQFDMNAWSQSPSKRVYLIKNDTSNTLRKGVRDLLHTYFQGDYQEATLTAGTSDHKSWTLAGYPAVFPFENPQAYNRALHSVQDTSQTINNLQLSERMVHLGLAFLAHYAGLVTDETSVQAESKEIQSNLSRDLKIAVASSSTKDRYQVIVAGPPEVKSIEFCRVEKKASFECSGEREVFSVSQEKGGRSFFGSSQALSLQAGQRFAVFGLSGTGKTTHLRTIRLDSR